VRDEEGWGRNKEERGSERKKKIEVKRKKKEEHPGDSVQAHKIGSLSSLLC